MTGCAQRCRPVQEAISRILCGLSWRLSGARGFRLVEVLLKNGGFDFLPFAFFLRRFLTALTLVFIHTGFRLISNEAEKVSHSLNAAQQTGLLLV